MLIIKNLVRRKVRTILSIIGISIGISAMVAFTSIVKGHMDGINNYARSSGAHLVVFTKNIISLVQSRIPKKDLDEIRKINGVSDVASTSFYVVIFPRFMLLFGRNPEERFIKYYQNERLKGRLIEKDDEIMLGTISVTNLNKKIGDEIEFLNSKFRVVGIYETNTIWENAGCIISERVLQKAWAMGDSANLAFIYLNDPQKWKDVADTIIKKFPDLMAIRTDDFSSAFGKQFEYTNWISNVISIIAIIIGCICVLNTMLMSISERVREIGTLRAVGWSRLMVFKLIFSEGILLSLFGGILGIILGVLGSQVIVELSPERFLLAQYPPDLLLKAMAIAIILGFIGALYPAYKSSKLSPIEALQYE